MKTIVVKVTFIGEGTSKEGVRILDSIDSPPPSTNEVMREVESFLHRFGDPVSTPGTSQV